MFDQKIVGKPLLGGVRKNSIACAGSFFCAPISGSTSKLFSIEWRV